ncbi:molybdate ABC transporter substrate-binding protein [Oceanospirillum sediminis]|uniref:Molybdate ABC transporter substrate-binding protein n=1 Tax=Oceanospirillum sediminis TaxID=2760088 RepID=A0A839IRW5_9GAMM|nr:molybdate ABC transporter substrate-binding protein [Oceanospirillum sediminis]MBB1487671.1 molybdate ABC transporter substrate-binding protein [Oceanospirillum sediminis]
MASESTTSLSESNHSIRVAVASNFAPTLKVISQRFEKLTGHKVVLVPGSTGKHYAQIRNGAPFALFFAADSVRPERLEQEKRIVPGSRFTYASGKLVLWSPENHAALNPEQLQPEHLTYLSIANPRLAPYGKAAKEVLDHIQLWDKLKGRIVMGENIAQAYHFVSSGNAQLGFVAWSQVLQRNGQDKGSYWHPPSGSYSPIQQQVVLLQADPVARQFLDYVRSSDIRQLIASRGYLMPDMLANHLSQPLYHQ